MTLGCGGYGGNITSDNISPRHLLNIKRLAYELTPVVSRWDRSGTGTGTDKGVGSLRLPSPPPRPPAPTGISAEALSRRIDEFLGSRGFRPDGHPMGIRPTSDVHPTSTRSTSDGHPTSTRSTSDGHPMSTGLPSQADQAPLDFVCEDDVRRAIQAGRQLVVAERAIVTPAARDLGEQHRIFSIAPWRG